VIDIKFPVEAVDGAHRVLLRNVPLKLQKPIANMLRANFRNQYFLSGCQDLARLELLSFSNCTTGLHLHCIGRLDWWRILVGLGGSEFPPLRPAKLALEEVNLGLDAVEIESRTVDGVSYELSVGQKLWPWPTSSRFGDSLRLKLIGDISESQLAVLTDVLQHAVRLSNTLSAETPAAFVENGEIVLHKSTPRTLLLETVYIWWQVCWVDVQAVIFDAEMI
jgi:hypothetical protein